MSLIEPIKKIYHESLYFYLHPGTYWQQIKAGKYKGIFGFRGFFLPGLFVAFICINLGFLLTHIRKRFDWIESVVTACRKTFFLFLLLTLAIIIARFIIKQFRFSLHIASVKKIFTYSISPALLTMIITGLFPFLDLGGIAPWYGFFLAYKGFESYFEIPEKKKFYFYFALFMAIFSLIMVLTFTLNRIAAHIIL